MDDFSQVLLEHLQHNAGRTPLCDKSPAEEIYAMFGVSKKVFKKAVGDLYKKRLIRDYGRGFAFGLTSRLSGGIGRKNQRRKVPFMGDYFRAV